MSASKDSLPELPSSDGTVNFGHGDQPAWARWKVQEYARKYGESRYQAGLAKAEAIARDWPAPVEGRVPLEIAAAIRSEKQK